MPEGYSRVLSDPEARISAIEDALSRLFSLVGDVQNEANKPNILIPELQRVLLDGDVTGPATETVVEGIWTYPITAPVAGDDEKVLSYEHSTPGYEWVTLLHNLLSATHSDTVAASPVRGDLIVGNSTPAWTRLAKGSSGQVLTMGANDPAWSTPSTSGGHPVIGPFVRNDMSNAATSDGKMPFGAPSTGVFTGVRWDPINGASFQGITIRLETAIAAGVNAYDVTLYKNGVATALLASVPNGFISGGGSGGGVTCNAGDTIDLYDKKTGTVPSGANSGVSAFLWYS